MRGENEECRVRIPASAGTSFAGMTAQSGYKTFSALPEAADLMMDTGIDKKVRGREKPSDHVPVWVELDA